MPHLLVYNEGLLLSVLLCPSTQRSPTSLCYFFRRELKKIVNIDTARFGIDKSIPSNSYKVSCVAWCRRRGHLHTQTFLILRLLHCQRGSTPHSLCNAGENGRQSDRHGHDGDGGHVHAVEGETGKGGVILANKFISENDTKISVS